MASAAVSPPAEAGVGPDPEIKMEHDTKPALTPPTSEGTMKKEGDDDSGSELSDLEPEGEADTPNQETKKEDDGEIYPDHYYDGGNVPVFKPTMDQFRSFKDFIHKIDKYGMKSGIVKVIPPQEWRNNLPDLDEMVKTIRVKNPITQEFHGSHGTYTQANMEKQRAYNLPQWKALCEESNHQPPAKRGERRLNQERPARAPASRVKKESAPPRTSPAPPSGPAKRGRKPGAKGKAKGAAAAAAARKKAAESKTEQGGEDKIEVPPTPTSPMPKRVRMKKASASDDEEGAPKGRQPKSVSSRRKHNRQSQVDVIDEEAFKSFDYRVYNQEEWTRERVQELETAYWKSLTFNNPMYGADMPGSLFKDSTKEWNVAQLENLLDVLGQKVPGVNTAYLYLGMWKATFAWHLEDVDLYSINYIHFGAPKQWYSISQADARRFEHAMQSVWPSDAKNCDQFLRHKTYLISPQLLQSQYNIRVNRLVHNEGEFVITFPYGYHSGYNLGYNCAESVNFATESWLDYGRIARKCNCEADSVWIDVRDIERKLRGEPTPEYYEETDEDEDEEVDEGPTDLPTPPGSTVGKAKVTKKRKRPAADKGPKPKVKKIRIMIKVPAKKPCVLCPNDNRHEKLLPTDNGKQAHRRCGLYTPETWVAEVDGTEKVCNVAHVDKARLDMKCQYCRSKDGAKFQCSFKKCTRGFHATCAAQAGVLVDGGPVAVFGEDGTEYSDVGFDFRCRYHRSKRGKNMDSAALEENGFIKKQASKLVAGDVVQAQFFQQEIFAGTVVANRKDEEMLELEALPKGERIEVEYKWVCVLDPNNSNRQLPSDNAKPMPAEILHNALDAPPPAADDPLPNTPFGDAGSGYKWSEFSSRKPFRNTAQVQVDLEKADKFCYYIGPTSTEARPHFSHDPASKTHNPKCLFLETVRPAPKPVPAPTARRSYPVAFHTPVNQNAINAARAHSQQSKGSKERPYSGKYAITDPVSTHQYRATNRFDPNEYQPRSLVDFSPHHYVQHQQNLAGGYSSSPISSSAHNLNHASSTPSSSNPTSSNNLKPTPHSSSKSSEPYASTFYNYGPSRLPYPNPKQQSATATPQHAQQQQAPAVANMSDPPPAKKLKPINPAASSAVESPLATPIESHGQTFAYPGHASHSAKHSLSAESSFAVGSPKPPEKKGVSYLKVPETYYYLHDAERNRPKIYQSPYASHGGFTTPWLPLPDAAPKLRPRGPSMSEQYLAKQKPSQQEDIAKQMSEGKARLQQENHERVQRRLSQSQNRPQMPSYFPQMSPTYSGHPQPRPQHLPMSVIQDPNSHRTTNSTLPHDPPFYDPHHQHSGNPNHPHYSTSYMQGQAYQGSTFNPYPPQTSYHDPSTHHQPSPMTNHFYNPTLPHHSQHQPHHQSQTYSPQPAGLQFSSPQDFRAQMEQHAPPHHHQQQQYQNGHGHLGGMMGPSADQGYPRFWNGVHAAASGPNNNVTNPTGSKSATNASSSSDIHTDAGSHSQSHSHSRPTTAGSATGDRMVIDPAGLTASSPPHGTAAGLAVAGGRPVTTGGGGGGGENSLSPLKNEFSGVGESTLPMMRDGSRF